MFYTFRGAMSHPRTPNASWRRNSGPVALLIALQNALRILVSVFLLLPWRLAVNQISLCFRTPWHSAHMYAKAKDPFFLNKSINVAQWTVFSSICVFSKTVFLWTLSTFCTTCLSRQGVERESCATATVRVMSPRGSWRFANPFSQKHDPHAAGALSGPDRKQK